MTIFALMMMMTTTNTQVQFDVYAVHLDLERAIVSARCPPGEGHVVFQQRRRLGSESAPS